MGRDPKGKGICVNRILMSAFSPDIGIQFLDLKRSKVTDARTCVGIIESAGSNIDSPVEDGRSVAFDPDGNVEDDLECPALGELMRK